MTRSVAEQGRQAGWTWADTCGMHRWELAASAPPEPSAPTSSTRRVPRRAVASQCSFLPQQVTTKRLWIVPFDTCVCCEHYYLKQLTGLGRNNRYEHLRQKPCACGTTYLCQGRRKSHGYLYNRLHAK